MKNIYKKTQLIMRMQWILLILLLVPCTKIRSQNLLVNSNMEDSTGWNIYHLGSANPAYYQFNHTTAKPSNGTGGCLRITSPVKTNILFWQKIKLKAGKSYTADGTVKINNVASFWCELYISTTAPTEGADYSPNSNGDVVSGFSTWAGCGPDVDGTFSWDGCTGKKIYKPSGNTNQDVEVYFALKTGSMASPLPNALEVLIDDLSVNLIQDSILLSTKEGTIDTRHFKVYNVSPLITVEKFRSGLHAAPTASVDIIGLTSGISVGQQDTLMIADTMAIKVSGINGTTIYPITLRPVSSANYICFTSLGIVDPFHLKIRFIPYNVRVAQLKSAIKVSPHATFTVLDQNNKKVSDIQAINPHMKIVVTAENGNKKTYALQTIHIPLIPNIISHFQDTLNDIKNKILTIKGNSELYITRNENPLEGSMINLKSENVWMYFPNIKPSVFYENYLRQILVNDSAAVVDKNIRLVQHLQGTVIISQSSAYTPLQIFSGDSLSGPSAKLGTYTYYRSQELGSMNDHVRSFKLKKGYMATLAKDELGIGYSRVYVAAENDLEINKLPVGLYDSISFIRVIPWRWVAKKGWTSGSSAAEALNCSWQYDWDNSATSQLNVEYTPMRHNKYWNSYENINKKQNSTHALGFNEPDRSDQANMTVNDAIAQWPELLKSGLRLGSPAPSDGGLDWLFQFIDRCDALNYRVDFVAMHWYLGGQSAKQFYDRLKYIHDRTKRPIWITEWNNGANWTCCKPTYDSQAATIAKFMQMLDTTSFVERYALYEWVEDTRHMFYKSPSLLTPAGEVYRDKKSPMAYNPDQAFYHDYVVPPVPPKEYAGTGVGFDYGKALAVDIDNDDDLDIIYSGTDPYTGGILKNDGKGNFTNTDQSLQGLYIPSFSAGDIEGDGDLDIILSGWDKEHGWPAYARILRNDSAGWFTQITIPSVNAPYAGFADLDNNGLIDYFMIGNGSNNNKFYFQKANGFADPVSEVSNGNNMGDPDATPIDIDNDQDVDFCIEAYNKSANRRYTQIWKNNGDGVFAEQANAFKQKHWGSAQFADIDNDGDFDMLLNGDGDGYSDNGSSDIYRLYINNGSGEFSEGAAFKNYRQNTNGKGSCFVDWDNDGDYDIILTGWSSNENKEVTHIYLNDATGTFTKSAEGLNIPGINKGTIELGDFNNDGRIDLLINGYSGASYARNVAFLIENSSIRVNTLPVAPINLQAAVSADSVSFTWLAGSDAETSVNALTYNLYVKGSKGKYYTFPNANVANGKRMTVGLGNAYHNLGWKLKGLPVDTYQWSVQTIDASYAGSAFAPEATFTIAYPDTTRKSTMANDSKAGLNNSNPNISIYPNPVGDLLTIKNLPEPTYIFIYSMQGQLMMTKNISGDSKLNVENLPSGIYTIKFNNSKIIEVMKFIKK